MHKKELHSLTNIKILKRSGNNKGGGVIRKVGYNSFPSLVNSKISLNTFK